MKNPSATSMSSIEGTKRHWPSQLPRNILQNSLKQQKSSLISNEYGYQKVKNSNPVVVYKGQQLKNFNISLIRYQKQGAGTRTSNHSPAPTTFII